MTNFEALASTTLIGLIGHGVRPSLSPSLHMLEGLRHGIPYVYRPLDLVTASVSDSMLGALIDDARCFGFSGLNVTHPVKQQVIGLLDGLDESAAAVGAANTVVFTSDGAMRGLNTDVTGFGAMMDAEFASLDQERIVQFGAGGAGSAVATALALRNSAELVLVEPDAARAHDLRDRIEDLGTGIVRCASLDDVPGLLAYADGIVNATPFGMVSHPEPAFDTGLLEERHWVADIVYRPVETTLLARARERGCRTIDGLRMAMLQAAHSFELFTGLPASRQEMLNDVRAIVEAEKSGRFDPSAMLPPEPLKKGTLSCHT